LDTKETNVVKESPFIGILRNLFHSKSAQLYSCSIDINNQGDSGYYGTIQNNIRDHIKVWNFSCDFIVSDVVLSYLPDVVVDITLNPLLAEVYDLKIKQEMQGTTILTLCGNFYLELIKDRFHKITEYTKEELELFIIEHQSSMLIEL